MLSERPLLVYLPGLDGTGKLFFSRNLNSPPTATSLPCRFRWTIAASGPT